MLEIGLRGELAIAAEQPESPQRDDEQCGEQERNRSGGPRQVGEMDCGIDRCREPDEL